MGTLHGGESLNRGDSSESKGDESGGGSDHKGDLWKRENWSRPQCVA